MINYDNSINIICDDNTDKVKYEIIDATSHYIECDETHEISNLLNDDNFFFAPGDIQHDNDNSIFTDNLLAQQIDYFENYNLKTLHHISNYYNISKTRLKKHELIELITHFENEPVNSHVVYNRKRLWHYIHELKNDPYFSKFIIFS